jgi:hypothetical protein
LSTSSIGASRFPGFDVEGGGAATGDAMVLDREKWFVTWSSRSCATEAVEKLPVDVRESWV